MATPARLPPEQRRTLARLIATPLPIDLYLAGGAAVGHHLGHRTSLDLDLFTAEPNADLSEARRAILRIQRKGAEPRRRKDMNIFCSSLRLCAIASLR
jgi:Nucleotidyl transferase AbiEii toxin, Type IV TA system